MATKPSCHYLPEEVIEQILVKIRHTKYILRCTLVCKLWYFLIKSPRFINTHLSESNNTKFLLCHALAFRDRKIVDEYSLCSDTVHSENGVPLMFPRGLKDVKVHGCCNGVICYTKLGENRGDIYLWNPFVRKFKILPKFREKYYRNGAKETIGFWFDEEKSDYEVVKISYTRVASCVDVYSLRTNSWKIISDSCPGISSSISEGNVVYAKGTLYWLAEEWQGWRIFSLNMNNAMIREGLIMIREGLIRTSFETRGIIMKPWYLKGVDAKSLVILRMNDLGVVCITKVHEESLELSDTDLDTSFCNEFCVPLGFRNNGEALLGLRKDTLFQLPKDMIVSYDFGAKKLTNFLFSSQNLLSAHPFVETLALLNESDADVFGWEKMVGILKTSIVKILNCEWLVKF